MGSPDENADVIIQADFEILFLGPNPAAMVELSPLAERLGRPPGRVFRLTKTSIIRAILALSPNSLTPDLKRKWKKQGLFLGSPPTNKKELPLHRQSS